MKKLLVLLMTPVLSVFLCASMVFAAGNDPEILPGYGLTTATYAVFNNSGIEVSGVQASADDLVAGTTLNITKEGTYILSGSCADGHVFVKKSTGNVKLILNGLVLTAEAVSASNSDADTAITIKGKNDVTIEAVGTDNVITSNVTDSTAIKSARGLTLAGDGKLTVNGTAKNGIKVDNVLTIESGLTLVVNAQKNGIAADEEVLINGGDITVTATDGDTIRSNPDELELSEDGTAVAGTNGLVTIKAGTLNLTAGDDGIQGDYNVSITGGDFTIKASGDGISSNTDVTVTTDSSTSTTGTVTVGTVAIVGGTFNINAMADGIQAGTDLTINGGSYDIMTNNGYQTQLADDADSCKGLKAGSTLSVTDGTFTINSADDAIHSNEYVSITGGNFDIYTGDDGAHGDTSLIIGKEGAGENNPSINVLSSYEGLEAGTVYIYSGDIQVASSDDGINAAGDNTSSGDSFNPGGGFPGRGGSQTSGGTASSAYSINISGGKIYVNADGDGLDSNGTISITGGNVTVYGQAAGGDNNPLDSENGCTISAGATVFAAGSSAMNSTVTVNGQGYYLSSGSSQGGPGGMGSTSTRVTAGSTISIMSGSDVIASFVTPKTVNYIFYTSPDMASNTSYTMSTSATTQKKVTSITATPANVELTVGETGKISIVVAPADATNTSVNYVSSDSTVAKVNSNGTITAIGEGSAIITITAKDGSNVSTQVAVKVNKKEDGTTPGSSTDKTTESTTENPGTSTESTTEDRGGSTESTTEDRGGSTESTTENKGDSTESTTENKGNTTPSENNTATNNTNTTQAAANTTVTISDAVVAQNTLTINAGLKVSQTKKQINVSWGAVSGADGYDVYAAYCSTGFTNPIMTVGPANTKVMITEINGQKIDLKKNFKVYVIAYKMVGSNKITLAKTIVAHVVGVKNTKYTNAKKIKLTKSKVTLTVGKTSKIKAKTVLVSKSKKQLSNKHAKEFRYASSNQSVATVTSKGVIKAVGKGSCVVYVYSRNGYAKAVTVNVK